MRNLRLNMLRDRPSEICRKCYEQESYGYSHSPRKEFNRNFAHRYKQIRQTSKSGEVEEPKFYHLDVRFSNVCNFRCRSCGPWSSSRFGSLLRIRDVVAQLTPYLKTLEVIYFAGGEPLLMKEHYQILEWLIENHCTDVQLNYTTNFSVTRFQKWDVFELWKKFKNVTVVASVDAVGARGSYVRPGFSWHDALERRREMKRLCPHVDFYVNSTVSALNAFHLPELHKTLFESGFIDSKERFFLNPVLDPEHLRMDVLPAEMKAELTRLYKHHLKHFCTDWTYTDATNRNDWPAAVKLIDSHDHGFLLPKFLDEIKKMDELGYGRAEEVFPELRPLFS